MTNQPTPNQTIDKAIVDKAVQMALTQSAPAIRKAVEASLNSVTGKEQKKVDLQKARAIFSQSIRKVHLRISNGIEKAVVWYEQKLDVILTIGICTSTAMSALAIILPAVFGVSGIYWPLMFAGAVAALAPLLAWGLVILYRTIQKLSEATKRSLEKAKQVKDLAKNQQDELKKKGEEAKKELEDEVNLAPVPAQA